MARDGSAWCPGGRTAQKAFLACAGHDLVDRMDRGAGRAQGRLEASGRNDGVGVEPIDGRASGIAARMAST